jgi:riboflavin kinase/FMN adenylyltransferase
VNLPATVDSFESIELEGKSLYLAVGIFDGVHLGHQEIIKTAIQSACNDNAVPGILTFSPHPSQILNPEHSISLLLNQEMKTKLFIESGVDLIIQKPFTVEFAAIKANEFIAYLKRSLPTLKAIYVGDNFRFGQGREGGVRMLVSDAQEQDIQVFISKRIKRNGIDISSTLIRSKLIEGQIEEANAMLGYPYFSYGLIERGQKMGRKIGFPTINLSWLPELRPRYGVYAVKVRPDGGSISFGGVANYGVRPTFSNDQDPVLEVHLFKDCSLNPGDAITVDWYAFIRSEEKFASDDELKKQIAVDKVKAKNFLATLDKCRN